MHEIGRRRRSQPPPPHVVFEALTEPDRGSGRPWLELLDDEQQPRLLETRRPDRVVWSSIWTKQPDAVIEFDIASDGGGGTDLCWTLSVAEMPVDGSRVGHMRKRLNVLINQSLRYSFGQ